MQVFETFEKKIVISDNDIEIDYEIEKSKDDKNQQEKIVN